MKETTFFLCLVFIAGIADNFSDNPEVKQGQKQIKTVYVQYFNNGDTLHPDYVCPDTLIIFDAVGLNNGWALIEQGYIDPTDYDIDSLMHTHAAPVEMMSGKIK